MSHPAEPRGWWERPVVWIAAVLLMAAPLVWPVFPPLNDMPEHIGRYHVALELSRSADLQRHWDFRWALIPNLGVDLAVMPLGRLVGAVMAAKLVVLLIPPLTALGLVLVAREATGRVPPTLGFALPLAYAYPFQMGFVNFALATALALLALAGWMRLGRDARVWRRTLVFLPVSLVLWIAHSFGWGLFGLFAATVEALRRRREGARWPSALAGGALVTAPLGWPALLMLGGGGEGLGASWEPVAKLVWVASLLRDRWIWFDLLSAMLLVLVLYGAARSPRLRFDPVLGALALVAMATFLALPRLLMGGAYVDMRMLPIAVALALVAIRPADNGKRTAGRLALLGAGFFAERLVATTISLALAAQAQAEALAVLPAIPRGATLLVLVNEPCSTAWDGNRLGHVAGIAVAKRDVFENGQWALAGQQLIRPRHPELEPLRTDPSQLIRPDRCQEHPLGFRQSIRRFDRHTVTHVWLIGFGAPRALSPDLRLVWANRRSALYRVRAAI